MERVLKEGNRTPADSQSIAARREEILDEATRLFARLGFADTDTQVLVDNLGVGKGTLYRYFSSKRELFLAAVDRVMRRMRGRIDDCLLGVVDPLEQMSRGIRAYLAFFAENPGYVELLIQERALFKDRTKPTYFEHRENNQKYWHALYRACIAEGRMRDIPVERISDTISNLLYGKMLTNYFIGQSKNVDEQASDVLDIIFHGILSEEERARQNDDRGGTIG